MINDESLTNRTYKENNQHANKVYSVWFTKNGRNKYQNYVGMSEEEIRKGWENITKQDKRYKLMGVVEYNDPASDE